MAMACWRKPLLAIAIALGVQNFATIPLLGQAKSPAVPGGFVGTRAGEESEVAGVTLCRSAFRLRIEPERRYDHIGFRVVAVHR